MSTRPRRPAGEDDFFIVGLVGRTGSGKSTVARALAATGAVVIEGDALGHEVTDQDAEVRSALIEEYGPEIYLPSGALDRRAVARRVFDDAEARARLDRLVHPRILSRIRARLDRLRAEEYRGVVVIDAALLLEWGLERGCDAVIAVTAPEEEQIARLTRARGWSPDESRARLRAQRASEDFARAADLVMDNRRSEADLAREAVAAVARLRAERSPGAGAARKER